jgi:hypothetical protein
MPATIPIELQVVNGDPATSGGNINITTATVGAALADEVGSVSLSTVASGDTITISGLTYSYEYLGSHLVRGDPDQPAAYIRIVGPLPSGSTLSVGDTFAIDLTGEPGDPDYPNLQNGNTKGDVASLDTTTPIQFPGFVCFAKGTHIRTDTGDVLVESLKVGDFIETFDHGLRPIVRVLHRRLIFNQDNAQHRPIEFKPGSLGEGLPAATLCVSPQHRILVILEDKEKLVAAKGFLHRKGVRVKNGCKAVDYFHLIFDRHEIIFAEGVATESFLPGPLAMSALEEETHAELRSIFPELNDEDMDGVVPTARDIIGPSRAQRIMKASVQVQAIGL